MKSLKSVTDKCFELFSAQNTNARCIVPNTTNEMLINQKHGQTNVDPGLVLTELLLERLDPE